MAAHIRSSEVVAIVGPTAVGKSALADRLASAVGGQIISADSMQVYRGMDIGTAKTPPAERSVAYHCLDLVEPGFPFSAALYQRAARDAIDAILAGGSLAVLTGGTGLYVRAALDDWHFPSGEPCSELRSALEDEALELGPERLHLRLRDLDPRSAALIHPANVRRTIRALEMAAQGVSYADQAQGFSRRESVYRTRYVGLTMQRESLYERIDSRVDQMVAEGLVEEVDSLLDAGFRSALTARQAIGYKEIVPVVEHGADLDEAVQAIKQATRRYAKRQMSWFRGDDRIVWLDVTELEAGAALGEVMMLLESDSPPERSGTPAPGTWRIESEPDR